MDRGLARHGECHTVSEGLWGEREARRASEDAAWASGMIS